MTGKNEGPQRAPAREGQGGWIAVREVPPLEAGPVHVWTAELPLLEPYSSRLEGVLDRAERERAERFRFERDRARFILSHGWIRILLGRYLRRAPAGVELGVSEFGKPFVQGDSSESSLQFSLSHSGELATLAVARGRCLGVDIEKVRPERATLEIAARFFSREEAEALRALAPESRVEAFFRCWTRKEAYVKARGEGLSRRLDRFSVSLGVEEFPSLRPSAPGDEESLGWSLRDLTPPSGYAAAIAAEGSGWPLLRFRPSAGLIPAD